MFLLPCMLTDPPFDAQQQIAGDPQNHKGDEEQDQTSAINEEV
jgi:hypothetical protein